MSCEDHKQYTCACCKRFCDSKRMEVESGLYICSKCQKTLVTKDDVTRITGVIRQFYIRNGLGKIPHVYLHAVSHSEMKRVCGSDNAEGFAQMDGDKYSVYFFKYLNKSVFAMVFAHEILHIWQYDRQIHPPLMICEGFCDLGSYLFLKTLKDASVAAMHVKLLESNPDPVYGNGLRFMLDIYSRDGWAGAIKELNKYKI